MGMEDEVGAHCVCIEVAARILHVAAESEQLAESAFIGHSYTGAVRRAILGVSEKEFDLILVEAFSFRFFGVSGRIGANTPRG